MARTEIGRATGCGSHWTRCRSKGSRRRYEHSTPGTARWKGSGGALRPTPGLRCSTVMARPRSSRPSYGQSRAGGGCKGFGAKQNPRLVMMDWSPELFEPLDSPPPGSEEYAVELVATLVRESIALGVQRREFSLASKVLYWLLPWRIPVYDSFVRSSVDDPGSWDHPEAYALIAKELFGAARQRTAGNSPWMGSFEPRSPLRAFDKWFWWVGGGNLNTAVQVRNPWRVVDELGRNRL